MQQKKTIAKSCLKHPLPATAGWSAPQCTQNPGKKHFRPIYANSTSIEPQKGGAKSGKYCSYYLE